MNHANGERTQLRKTPRLTQHSEDTTRPPYKEMNIMITA